MVAAAPPPPPPLPAHHGGGAAVPPPPPPTPGSLPNRQGFKIVAGLGEALREAKLKKTGFEETPAAAEGVSCGDHDAATSSARPKSWHGKPPRNRALVDEMQSKLAARRAKVDQASEPESAPSLGVNMHTRPEVGRKLSAPARSWTPSSDYAPSRGRTPSADSRGRTPGSADYGPEWTPVLDRKFSQDSGLRSKSWTPPVTGPNQYSIVSVDHERKEELLLAKQVRQNSVKILRMSPCQFDQPQDGLQLQQQQCRIRSQSKEPVSVPPVLPPPSPVVMRYWNQCQSNEASNTDEKIIDPTNTCGTAGAADWKADALEGDLTEFPSIKEKISTMEKPKMVTSVPNVKKNLNLGESKPAGWMEARLKLQAQLDTLLSRTSAKMSGYARRDSQDSVKSNSSEQTADENNNDNSSNIINKADNSRSSGECKRNDYTQLDTNVKSLIKSVAFEIQKSFSEKNLAEEEDETQAATMNQSANKEAETDDAGIADETADFAVPTADPTTTDEAAETVIEHPSLEGPVDFESAPSTLDTTVSKQKLSVARKISRERRLPASILAKRRAAEKLKAALTPHLDLNTDTTILVTEDKEEQSDEDRAEELAKQMANLEHSQVLQILRTVEQSALEFSIPLLMPLLSLQVKLSLSKDIFNGLDSGTKSEVVRESFISSLVNDITDIAILQEVIDRSREKLKELGEYEPPRDSSTQADTTMKDVSTLTDKVNVSGPHAVEIENLTLSKEKDANNVKRSDSCDQYVYKTMEEAEESIESKTTLDDTGDRETHAVDTVKDANESTKGSLEEAAKDSEDSAGEDKSEDDSGVDTEEALETADSKAVDGNKQQELSKSKSEKNIKAAILDILKDAKAQEKTRSVRNFGRNFEFQQTQLKPTIPNDRRPLKARRMDSMWNQQITARTGNFNGVPCAPKPALRVPWTNKGNNGSAAIKKDSVIYDKDVEEFEKCRTNLNSQKREEKSKPGKPSIVAVKANKETIAVQKIDKDNITKVDSAEEVKNKTTEKKKVKNDRCSTKNVDLETTENVEEEKVNSKEKTTENASNNKDNVNLDSDESMIQEDVITDTDNKPIENEDVKIDLKIEKKEIKEGISSETDTEEKDDSEQKEIQKKSANNVQSKAKEECFEKQESKESESKTGEVNNGSEKEKCKITTSGVDIKSKTENNPEKDVYIKQSTVIERQASTPPTPVIRRREVSFGGVVIKASPSAPPPPPPAFRPPPPPMSPPPQSAAELSARGLELVNSATARFHRLQTEVVKAPHRNQEITPLRNAVQASLDNVVRPQDSPSAETPTETATVVSTPEKILDSSSSSEDESEWEEWTEEVTDSEDDVAEILASKAQDRSEKAEQEQWENIMSDSAGPTTFTAQFSIKIP